MSVDARLIATGLLLGAVASTAQAQPATVVAIGQTLALAGLGGGAIGGVWAGYRKAPVAAFWPAFGIYMLLLCAAASTRAGSFEIVPLALVLGAGAGIVPFAAAWFGLRFGVARLRDGRSSER